MTDLLATIPSFPVSQYAHLTYSLEKACITATDLLTLDSVEIAKRARLPPLDVKRLAEHVLAYLQAELGITGANSSTFDGVPKQGEPLWGTLRTKSECLERSAWTSVSIDGGGLDTVCGGGIPPGYITEIVGESGAGKTQLLLSLLVRAQLPAPHGLGRPTIYISTEHQLPAARLAQMIDALDPVFDIDASLRPTLSRVLSIHTPDLESQEHILTYQLPVALKRHNIGLIVIDSIAANYRSDENKPEVNQKRAAALAIRSAQLIKLGALLRSLAREHNCAIVVANQVSDRFVTADVPTPSQVQPASSQPSTQTSTRSTNANIPSSSPTPAPSSSEKKDVMTLAHQQRFFTGWGDSPPPQSLPSTLPSSSTPNAGTEAGLKTPSLGLTWANQIACRIALVKESNRAGSGEGSAWRRCMRMVFAPWARPTYATADGAVGVEFEVWEGGVRAVTAT